MSNESTRRLISHNDFMEIWGTGDICPVCHEERTIAKMPFNGMKYPQPCACERARLAAERQAEEEKKRKEEHRQYVERLTEQSGLPRRERGYRFDNFSKRPGTEAMLDAVKGYADNFEKLKPAGMGLVISGPTGCGKTHLISALVNELLEREHRVRFWNTISLFQAIQASFDNRYEYGDDIIADCDSAEVLVLDDVGTEKPSEWTRSTFYSILNSRIDDMLPTILTTNLTLGELAGNLDSRIASRLSDKRCFTKISARADDFRKTAVCRLTEPGA